MKKSFQKVLISSTITSIIYVPIYMTRIIILLIASDEYLYSLPQLLFENITFEESQESFMQYYGQYTIVENAMYCNLLWHTFSISSERLLLLYNSYKDKKNPVFVRIVLLITVVFFYFYSFKNCNFSICWE